MASLERSLPRMNAMAGGATKRIKDLARLRLVAGSPLILVSLVGLRLSRLGESVARRHWTRPCLSSSLLLFWEGQTGAWLSLGQEMSMLSGWH